jgi:hypothetical protein
VLIIGFPESVWSVDAILTMSSPIVFPLTLIPAANRIIVGAASLADFTAALTLLAFPLLFLGRRSRT